MNKRKRNLSLLETDREGLGEVVANPGSAPGQHGLKLSGGSPHPPAGPPAARHCWEMSWSPENPGRCGQGAGAESLAE